MTTGPPNASPPNPTLDTANLGVVRPPFVYLTSILVGVLIQLTKPLPFLPRSLAMPVGVTIILLALALFFYSVAKFRAAGTPVPARKPTTTIVRTGPYRFTRNPIYLAFSLLQLGIAIWINSLWLLATLVVAMALIHYVVMPKEERYLAQKFGAPYLDYKASVRRWL
jgi:protein-S-isoprenylcysteine O-methyltransferase Ste14